MRATASDVMPPRCAPQAKGFRPLSLANSQGDLL